MQKPEKPNISPIDAMLIPIQQQSDIKVSAIEMNRLFNVWLRYGNTPESFEVGKARKFSDELLHREHQKRAKIKLAYKAKLGQYEKEKIKANIKGFQKLYNFHLWDDVTFLHYKWNEKIVHEEEGWKLTVTPIELLEVRGTWKAIGDLPDIRIDKERFKQESLKYNGFEFNIDVLDTSVKDRKGFGKSHVFRVKLTRKF